MPDAVKSDKTTKENRKPSNELKTGKNAEKDTETKAKETTTPGKGRSVSFNRDVHVKRFGKPREARGASGDTPPPTPSVRREPFTHLSEQQLIAEAEKVLEQAGSVSCTTQPPEKFFSLPYRKKHKPDLEKHNGRRRSEELGITSDLPDKKISKSQLARSTSDVSNKSKKSPRSSLSTLFRKNNRSLSPETLKLAPKPIVKRSKSDVSDLKSHNRGTSLIKPLRNRSGSESEENLNTVRTQKNQLSPIIEINPREDYFRQNSIGTNLAVSPDPSGESHAKLMPQVTISATTPTVDYTVNPIEKPPRFKNANKSNLEPKPPQRSKRSNTLKENRNSYQAETKASTGKGFSTLPKKKVEKKSLVVDEIDKVRDKDINPKAIKKNIKSTIQLLKNKFNSELPKDNMVHSSQQPADKLPLTKGHAVENIVKILKEDQLSPPPKSHIINPPNAAHSVNQPFSYIRPGISPEPNLPTRASSPPTSPVAIMNPNTTQGVVYAQVVCNQGDKGIKGPITKQTVHKTYSPMGGIRYGSDEDEGLGNEESKYTNGDQFEYGDKMIKEQTYGNIRDYRLHDSPITPRFKDFKLTTFIDYEPTYANHFPIEKEKKVNNDFTVHRGRGDGMDSKRRVSIADQPNDLSYRRAQLESRMNARRLGENISTEKIIPTYSPEEEYIAETADRMKATEKYVNETARYYRSTIESGHDSVDGFLNSDLTNDHHTKIKHKQDSIELERLAELDRRQFLDRRLSDEPEKRILSPERKRFPPEPEYEPPSLESHAPNPVLSPDEYVERKYKLTSRQFTTSQDALNTGQKYLKDKEIMFGSRKGHYASNPEIAQEREDDYVNSRVTDSYNSFVKRDKKNMNSRFEERNERVVRQEISAGPYEDYDPAIRRIYDNDRDRDNKFVDSGIENDFRKDSNGEINRGVSTYTTKVVHKQRRAFTTQGVESDDEGFASSQLIASERRHTEDNHSVSERRRDYRSYPNQYGEADYRDDTSRNSRRERSRHDSPYDPRRDKLSPGGSLKNDGNLNAKPPKATKKISGLEKVKQLFSRDSSKKSKKEKEVTPTPLPASSLKHRTRVLKSPEQDELRSRYTEYRGSSVERDSGSELRTSKETTRKSRSRTGDPERRNYANDYSQRRRLATPSPTPSPPRRADPAPSSSWFKSLDRLTRKGKTKVDKESVLTTTEDESTVPPLRKAWNTKSKASTPTKNLRFFGDTDLESGADSISKHKTLGKTRSLVDTDYNSDTLTNKRSISASASGIDVLDRKGFSNRMSNSMSNLENRESRHTPTRNGYSKKHRDLHNISENYNHSEIDSNVDDKAISRERRYESKERHIESRKPPQSPFRDPERRSRSRSASKGAKTGAEGSRSDLRRTVYQNGRNEFRNSEESRDSSSEIRRSRQELSGSRSDLKSTRRRTPGTQSGESSTEGDSSQQSQRSVVFLHATTVGDIPKPGRTNTGSRDDVSQVRTVTKTFGMLAPWRPRLRSEANDVNYSQSKQATKRTHKQQHQKSPTPKTETSFFGKNKSPSTKNLTSKHNDRNLTPKYDDKNMPSKYNERNLSCKYDRSLTPKYDDRSSMSKYDDRNSLSKYDERIYGNSDLSRNGKSASQTTLTRRTKHTTPSRLTSSNGTLYKKSDRRNGYTSSKENVNTNVRSQTLSQSKKDSKMSMSTEVLSKDPYGKSDSEKISRSISMPRDPKKSAGWFRLAKKNKKPDHLSRVR